MISRRIIINVITFLLLSAGLITGLVVSIFRVEPKYSVFAEMTDTGGAFTGQEVTYRGVTVGRIGSLDLIEGGVRMELVISRDFDEIPEDTDARVMFKSAVGEQFVDLSPRTQTPPYLTQGDVIPKDRVELPVQQEELLRLLDAVLEGVPPDAIRNLIDALGTGLGGRGDELHLALAALDPVTATLAERTGTLNDLNVSADRLGAAFDRSRTEFATGVRALAGVAETLADASGDTEELLETGARELPHIAGLVAARKSQINRIVANLAEVTEMNFDNLGSVEDLLDWMPLFLDAIIQAYDVDAARFRFGQVLDQMANPPCDYGTPRRATSDRSGNAPYHPILDFDCEGAEASASETSAAPPVEDAAAASRDPRRPGWSRLLFDVVEVG